MNITSISDEMHPEGSLGIEARTIMLLSGLRMYPMLTTTAITIIMTIITIINRLYMHPLSKIPGPKLAAITSWYQFYYDIIENESAVIRISPNHIHVNDPDFMQNNLKEYLKPSEFYDTFGIPSSFICLTDPHKHRARRSALGSLFSSKAMNLAAPVVADIIERAANHLTHGLRKNKPVNIQRLYSCITTDSVFCATFGKSLNFVECEEEKPGVLASLELFKSQIHIVRHFPFLVKLVLNLPVFIAERMIPGYIQFRQSCESWISEARRKHGVQDSPDESKNVDQVNTNPNESEKFPMFDALLPLSTEEDIELLSTDELIDEAFGLVSAGIDTTAYTLACGTYYLLKSPEVLLRLQKELDDNIHLIKDPAKWQHIQSLPYLTAVIQEILRLSSSLIGFFPRVTPPGGVSVQSHHIPGGTMVSMSRYLMHYNPDYFPEPESFKPERWLGKDGKELEKWNFSFSKGIRRCLGLPLANLELSLCFSYFFSRFEMELYNTDASSMEWFDHGTADNKKDVEVRIIQDRWA